ncbi:hypothetical protein ALC62_05812 [Cyphomyrmex costatus]|uniref:Phospholipase A2-like domain-containing protein n=1 Tax=Cyphomyrmex costatus TaxID=456900 RepID=A0A151IJI2_9HYME|nr:hypothetical protein ALC62_05812 [Cyphomyrmex costatus]
MCTGLLNATINALPFKLHIPEYQFYGPGTRLAKRLARGDRGINQLDAACREHDIAYSQSKDLASRHSADRVLADKAKQRITASDSTFGEKAAATAVWAAMKTKTKLGMGVRKRKKSKGTRILSVAKRGGFLLILPVLGALGSLIGGAASVAKAVSDRKAARRQLEELQRHNRAMEGRGLYIAPYKRGGRVRMRTKRVKKNIVEENSRGS